ncbi:MAG: KEOPS complex kinase/ATPase Bud32 [Candidatus Diapherotrites archaeon]
MISMKLLRRGAEAELWLKETRKEKILLKKRAPKEYRRKELDERIRKHRTRSESNLIARSARIGVKTPQILDVNEKECTIEMEFIEGKRLKDALNERNVFLCKEVGKEIALMHREGIIHGDLTTSNVILNRKKELIFIDFGLGFHSNKIEDKAVDLLVFKKTFMATHFKLNKGWQLILEGYRKNYSEAGRVIRQIKKVEERGRYL